MNNSFPKAAFFDIDGTLVPYDTRCVSREDCDAIEALHKQGTLIFIVTGRHICDIDNIPFPVNGAVCSNGALTYMAKYRQAECRGGASFHYAEARKGLRKANGGCAHFYERERFVLTDEHPIPKRQAIEIARIIDNNKIPASASTSTRTMFGNLTQKNLEFIRCVNMPLPKEDNILEAAINESIYNFNAFISLEEEKSLFKDALQGLETPRWCDEFCDINVCGLDKVVGIKKILDIYHIDPSDIIAFGDGFNDIAMLKFAGRGIAMRTATDEVKSAADYVTASAGDCGVNKWVSSFLGI